jgi:ABC transporter family protein
MSDTPPPAPEPRPAPAANAPTVPFQARGRPSRFGYLFFGGLFALLSGLVWYVVERDTGATTVVWIFLAVLAMLIPFAWHAVDLVRAVASRRGIAFGFVLATIGLALFVAVLIAWIDLELKKNGALPTLDLTRSAKYSLSEESQRLLERVPGTVYATYLTRGQGDPEDPDLRNDVLEQLHVYGSSTGRVKVEEADELRYPERAEQVKRAQGVTSTSSGEDTDVVVLTYAEPGREVAPGKQKEVKVERYAFRKESATGARKWLGEVVITDAIYELVFQKNKAYATGGHGERSLREFGELKDALTRQNIEVASQPVVLASGARVPDDCELLLVLAPQTPFTGEEAEAVSQWLDKGKTLFVAVDLQEDRVTNALDDVLAKYGIETRANYEVLAPRIAGMMEEKAIARMGPQFPVYGPSYGDHPATRALAARAGLATFFVKSTYLEVYLDKPPQGADPKVVCYAPQYGEDANTRPLAIRHSSDRKSYRPSPDTDKNADPSQPTVKLPLIATSSRKVAAPSDGKGSPAADRDARVIVSGDADVFSDAVVSHYPANLDLARGLVQWGLRREGLVAVSERTLESPWVAPDEYQRRFALLWPLFVCCLPLIAGGMVWWSRRR